jgi:hypothetical protein
MQAVDFWTQPGRLETLSRLALMDRVKAAMSTAQSRAVLSGGSSGPANPPASWWRSWRAAASLSNRASPTRF